MAASAPSAISTKANPRLRPVSRSVTTWALVTCPYWPKAARRSSLVVSNDRLPTYNFLLTVVPCGSVPAEKVPRPVGRARVGRLHPGRRPAPRQDGPHPQLPTPVRAPVQLGGSRPPPAVVEADYSADRRRVG